MANGKLDTKEAFEVYLQLQRMKLTGRAKNFVYRWYCGYPIKRLDEATPKAGGDLHA